MILERINSFREKQRGLLASHALGEIVSVNVTKLCGGMQVNVIPRRIELGVDMRVPPGVRREEAESIIDEWIKGTGYARG